MVGCRLASRYAGTGDDRQGMELAVGNTAGLSGLSPTWELQDMTSLAEAESKYGHVVLNAGGQIFGIERATSVGRQEES
jgi:hypothetical protein